MAITDINISGKLRADDGDAVASATVIFRETEAALGGAQLTAANTTTNSAGTWTATITAITANYDVQIDKGNSTRYIPWSDEIALKTVDTSVLKVRGASSTDHAPIYLFANLAADAGDGWRIEATNSDTLMIGSDKASAGTIIDYVEITNGANAAASSIKFFGTGQFESTLTSLGTLTVGAGGNEFSISESSDDITIKSLISDKDLKISGNDGGSNVDALSFDMSDAGRGVFNNDVRVGVDLEVLGALYLGAGANEFSITESSDDITIKSLISDKDLKISGNDGGSNVDALSFDMSAAGKATFNDVVVIGDSKLTLGSTAVTSTAAELNLLDGVSGLVQADLTKLAAVDSTAGELNLLDGSAKSTSSITIVDADAFVVIDGTTTKQIPASNIKTYVGGAVSAVANGSDNRVATFSSSTALNGEANLTFDGSDLTLANDVGLIFGDAGEKIEGDGTDLFITGNKTNISGTTTVGGETVGYGSPALTVRKSGDTCITTDRASDTGPLIRFTIDGTEKGSISSDGSTTAFNTSSDYRLKENQTAISDGLTRVKALKPYRYNFKADSGTTRDGFFAHEAATVVPESVTGAKDATRNGQPEHQGMDNSKLVPILVAALKEIDARVTALE